MLIELNCLKENYYGKYISLIIEQTFLINHMKVYYLLFLTFFRHIFNYSINFKKPTPININTKAFHKQWIKEKNPMKVCLKTKYFELINHMDYKFLVIFRASYTLQLDHKSDIIYWLIIANCWILLRFSRIHFCFPVLVKNFRVELS